MRNFGPLSLINTWGAKILSQSGPNWNVDKIWTRWSILKHICLLKRWRINLQFIIIFFKIELSSFFIELQTLEKQVDVFKAHFSRVDISARNLDVWRSIFLPFSEKKKPFRKSINWFYWCSTKVWYFRAWFVGPVPDYSLDIYHSGNPQAYLVGFWIIEWAIVSLCSGCFKFHQVEGCCPDSIAYMIDKSVALGESVFSARGHHATFL